MISQVQVNVNLINLLHFLISKLLMEDSYCTIIYYDQSMYTKRNQLVHVIEKELLLNQVVTVWIAADSDDAERQLESAIEIGCQSYMTLTDNLERFFEMKLEIKDRTEQRIRDTNFLIFSDSLKILAESAVFQEAMNFYPNVWIVSLSDEKGYEILTQNYTRADLAELYSLNVTDALNSSIFHDKLFDLGGRDVNVAVLDYGPYCLTTHVGEDRGNADSLNSTLRKELRIDGIEGNLIVEFCKLRKCNLKLLPLGPNNWGHIDENGTGDGILYATYAKKTELSFCSTSVSWVYDLLDGSHPVASSVMKLLVPRAKVLPTFLTPVYPFESKLWVAIFVTLISMTLVLHGITALNCCRVSVDQPPIIKSIFDTIAIYLDQQMFLYLSTFSYRILVAFIFLSGVVLSNSYSGGLACVLTVPRFEKSLETTHDFATSPYRWAASSIAYTFTIAGADSPDLQAVVRKIEVIPDLDQLYRRTLRGDIGVAVELLNSQKIYPGPYIREDNVNLFELLRESIYYDYTGGVSQRGWPLMHYFNRFILDVVQGGFVIYWEREMLRKFQSYRLEMAMEAIVAGRKPDAVVQVLGVEHILGPVYILLIGSGLAIAVFLLEVFWRTIQDKLTKSILQCNISKK